MSFAEINLAGIYVAPISILLLIAWIVTLALRRLADRYGVLSQVWHPPLFTGAVYLIVLSTIVLLLAR